MSAFDRVLAEPASLEARRALLAEWERAADPRAALLAIELEAWRLMHEPPTPRYAKLRAEAAELVRRHGAAWAGRLAELVTRYRFHRGLVAEITLPLDRFVELADELCTLAPIQHLNLRAPATRFRELVTLPRFAQIVSFEVPGQRQIGDDDALELARSPHASQLRWIALPRNSIGKAGVEALATSPYLRQVYFLALDGNRCDPSPTVWNDSGVVTVEPSPIATELQRGRRGTGRLDVVGVDATGARLDGERLEGARLARVWLARANLGYTLLDDGELTDCDLTQAQLGSASLVAATVERCTFASVQGARLDLSRARVRDCTFTAAALEHTRWCDAVVERSSFLRATFGHARLERVRFDDCDLRGADLTGCVLAGAEFTRCRLDGVLGAPAQLGSAAAAPDSRTTTAVTFRATGDPRHPYQATVDGATWTIRLDEFPAEPTLYSLLIDGVVVEGLLDWPPAWTRPDLVATTEDAHERAEHDRELAHVERTRAIGPSATVRRGPR